MAKVIIFDNCDICDARTVLAEFVVYYDRLREEKNLCINCIKMLLNLNKEGLPIRVYKKRRK